MKSPNIIGAEYDFSIQTPDKEIDIGAELAVRALWEGATEKAGCVVPTVCGTGSSYPSWIHPYDNYWINRVSSYLFPRDSTEWPIRLFAAYQTPRGEILGGVYHIPTDGWSAQWEQVGGAERWQGRIARPLADHVAAMAGERDRIQYGIYVRDHLFVLQVYDQWLARGHLPFLIEMYGPCRRALKYLESCRDVDGNGLVETTCVLSDVVVAGDQDIHSTERAEDQVMLYGALCAFAQMAEQLGSEEDSIWAQAWAERVRSGLNSLMWRSEGRYIFGVERATKKPRLEYVTTTYANGYAILFGLASDSQTEAILDFMARQDFVVPGPYHIPPVREKDGPQNPPGGYCNGGCGWGRGIMPSVTLACFERGRVAQAVEYLKRQAIAASKAGSFHEFWTWEVYAGKTEPGGAPWYGETSAGYLDALVHGLFGLSPAEPGYRSLRLSPHFPKGWPFASLDMRLPQGGRLGLEYLADEEGISLAVQLESERPVEVILPWFDDAEPEIYGTEDRECLAERTDHGYRVVTCLEGSGVVRLRRR